MQAKDLLLIQLKQAHKLLESSIADCEPGIVNRRIDGATINHIGAIYAHVALAEDVLVNELVRGTSTIFDSNGWAVKLGFEKAVLHQDAKWNDLDIDLASFREYAAAVYRATEDYVESADGPELLREREPSNRSGLSLLGLIGVIHISEHWGEIAALKGVAGGQGLPF